MSENPVEDARMEEDPPPVDPNQRERELREQLLGQKRERELREQLLGQKRERELREQLLGQKRERELREQLLQQKLEQDLRAELLRRMRPAIAAQQPVVQQPVVQQPVVQQPDMNPADMIPDRIADDVMEEDQPTVGNVEEHPSAVSPPTSWAQLPDAIYQTLNPQDFSYQLTSDDQFFWHPAQPGILIRRGTFEMFHITNGAIGFYKNAHLIKKDHDPEYGSGFWLKPRWVAQNKAVYNINEYTEDEPDQPDGYIYVPWEHIVEHLYGYTFMGDKESHSFFPPGTTEAELLQYLVDALNSGTGKVPVGGVDAEIIWEVRGQVIKTFFRRLRDGHQDKYTIEETTFVKDNFD